MKTQSLRALIPVGLLAFASPAWASTWEIDAAHSSVGFAVRHMMVTNVKGQFTKFAGTVELDDQDISRSVVDVSIDAASIDTGVAKRDDHLRTSDFLEATKFPKLTFKSTKVERAGEGKLKVTGNLTIRGVTKPAVLLVEGPATPVKDPWGNTKTGITATTKINRKDFGVSWNKTMDGGGLVVGDEVTITIEAELQKKSGPTG